MKVVRHDNGKISAHGFADAPHEFRGVYIDNTVLEDQNVTEAEKEEIMVEGAREAERVRVEVRDV